MKKIRLVFAIILLMVSIALMVWGFSPNQHETKIQMIAPTEMQLPTPSSLHITPEPVA